MKRFLGGVAALVILVGCASEGPNVGNTAPTFTASSLATGKDVPIEDYRGKVVVLDFWATYCGPCKESMPKLAEMYKELKPKGMEVMAISAEGKGKVGPFALSASYSLPIFLDNTGMASSRYQVDALPTTVVLDRKGNVVFRQVGTSETSEQELRAAVEQALGS